MPLTDKLDLLRRARAARRETGKDLLVQAREILRLGQAPNRLSPSEYFDFGLYDDRRYDASAKATFIGWRSAVVERMNDRIWHALANDKLAYSALMQGLGVPVPRQYAIYHPGGRSFGGVPVFTSAQALGDFLRKDCPYPFFGKPVQGVFGLGDIYALAYDRASDSLLLKNGERRPVDAYCRDLDNPGGLGYLIQEALQPSPAFAAICGPRLSTVRVITVLSEQGARVLRCEWKIPVGNAMVDNYNGGKNGNLLAWVEHHSGEVRKIFAGGFAHNQPGPARHPDTDAPLLGIRLPNWAAICALAVQASSALPGLRLQGWDIADTERGPVAVEVNLVTPGGAYAVQRVSGQGLLEADVRSLYEKL